MNNTIVPDENIFIIIYESKQISFTISYIYVNIYYYDYYYGIKVLADKYKIKKPKYKLYDCDEIVLYFLIT